MVLITFLSAPSAATEREWTVADSVAVRYFVTDQFIPGGYELSPSTDRAFIWSPRNSRFFFVTRSGNLDRDCSNYVLRVFDVASLTEPQNTDGIAEPKRSATICSSSSELFKPGISAARWENEDSLIFTGVEAQGPKRLYRLNVASGTLSPLSNPQDDVTSFVITGNSLVYAARTARQATEFGNYPIMRIGRAEFIDLIQGATPEQEVFVSTGSSPAHRVDRARIYLGARISPDGNWAIATYRPSSSPDEAAWVNYELAIEPATNRGTRFMLLDLREATSTPVFGAPTGTVTSAGSFLPAEVYWSADSRNVLLVNTALPLGASTVERRKTPYIVNFNVSTREYRVLASMVDSTPPGRTFASVREIRQGQEIVLSFATSAGKPAAPMRLLANKRGWMPAPSVKATTSEPPGAAPPPRLLHLEVKESANDPPAAIAISDRREIKLTASDPALEGVRWTRVETIEIQEANGHKVTAGLLLPKGPGPHPLVVQAYYFVPHKFLPDGISPTAFAAQPLASRGMAVLQLPIPIMDEQPDGSRINGPDEGDLFVARLDNAIEMLTAEGKIDPKRVGLIGFSRGGYMTYYAITHPGRYPLAAALNADGWTASYSELLSDTILVSQDAASFYTSKYGALVWDKPQPWLSGAPGFNINRIVTPSLFVYNGRLPMLYATEIVSAAITYKKPVDFMLIPEGTHELQRPRERAASLEASVDWMSFWLQGKEDLAEEKSAQYDRWRRIRSSQMH
ncbi:MAG: prolyl oligopeptidase family serine peptidase [Gammaproteobacteria bacterium]